MRCLAAVGMLAVVLTMGCARTLYVHPTKTAEDFERDKYECEQQATAYAHNMGASGNPFMIVEETKRCLEKKHGWRKQSK